jgi:tetratricopeptide (TPR) repeat protein
MERFYVYLNQKEFKLAEEYYNKAIDAGFYAYPDQDNIDIAYLYMETGRKEEAKTILERCIKSDESNFERYPHAYKSWFSEFNLRLAMCYTILGENEKALKYLSEAQSYGIVFGQQYYIEHYAPFENLRDHPEFKAIVKRALDESAAVRAQVKQMEKWGEIHL